MALYKNGNLPTQSTHAAFDKDWKPGEVPPNAGIYKCIECGDEIASNKNVQLPPQNHHQHVHGIGPIRWRLIVCTESR